MSSNIPTITVSSEGVTVNAAYPLLSVEVNHQVNKIPYAKLVYIEADGYVGKLGIAKDEAFKPGKTIKINLRYEADASKDKTIFEGLIVQHKIKFNNDSAVLILELRHINVNLILARKNTIFVDKSDEEIFNEIGKSYPNIKFSSTVSSEKHKQMIQAWCSDWDFILSRAESNGWWLMSGIEGQLKLIDPANSADLNDSKIVFDLNTKNRIYALDVSMDILNQVDKISAESWDVDKQEVITETLVVKQNENFKKLENSTDYKLYHPGDLGQKELKAWVHSKQIKNDLSLFRGKIRLLGELNIEPGMLIKLNNLGPYFNGQHVVSSVRHVIDNNGFQTEIGIGMPADGLITMQNAEPPAAGAMLPAIKGLYIGVVKGYDEIESNEKNQLLVKVKLPLFGKEDNEVWGRLASIYAGSERGVVFRPEVDDEVVLGFFNDDPRYPVILGSMYSAKNKPPIEFTKENEQKAIVTKGKVAISLDDKIKSIALVASEESKISVVDQGDQAGISLEDANKNSIILNADGINCSSKADTKINAKQAVIIDATKVEVK